jgi:L-fuculose-phosphate aldolase
VSKTNVIILANHGTVSFGESVERAYWWTEILDAYCRILLLARQLGHVNYLSGKESRELLALKEKWGFPDARLTDEYKNCDICANDIFRSSWKESGVERRAFEAPPPAGTASGEYQPGARYQPEAQARGQQARDQLTSPTIDQEQLVKLITDEVMRRLP